MKAKNRTWRHIQTLKMEPAKQRKAQKFRAEKVTVEGMSIIRMKQYPQDLVSRKVFLRFIYKDLLI